MQLILPRRTSAFRGGGAVAGLAATLASTEFEYYMGDLNTWDGAIDTTARLKSICESPASGAAQGDYTCFFGVDAAEGTDRPTMSGTAGTGALVKATFDGGDFFNLAGANTTFLKNLHKTTGGQDFWVSWIHNATDDTWNFKAMFCTNTGQSAGTHGILIGISNNEVLRGGQERDDYNGTVTGADGMHLCTLSHSQSSNNWRMWLDTVTSEDIASSFRTSTTDPIAPMRISGLTSGGQKLTAEEELFWMAGGNEYLTDTKQGTLATYVEAIYGDLTP